MKKDYTVPSIKTVEEIFKEPKSRIHKIYLYFYRLFCRIVRLPGDIRRNIRDFIQRGRRGWADSDTWGFCDYLSNVILGGLKHLKKHKHGTPVTINPKTKEYDYDEKRWDEIMNKMIYTFETSKKILDNYPKNDWFYTPTKEWNKQKSLRDKFSDGKLMYVMTKKECLKYEKGFKLFQEYFYSLWD